MWDVARDGVQHGGGAGEGLYKLEVEDKLQLCGCAGVSLPACFALSSGQETPSVSAVSLTANEFPGGGVVAVYVYACV